MSSSRLCLVNTLKILVAGALLASVDCAANPTRKSPASPKGCKNVPSEMMVPCLKNGESKPYFHYYQVSYQSDCNAFLDSAIVGKCKSDLSSGKKFTVAESKIDSTGGLQRVMRDPLDQIASMTKTMVVLTAVNTLIAVSTVVIVLVQLF